MKHGSFTPLTGSILLAGVLGCAAINVMADDESLFHQQQNVPEEWRFFSDEWQDESRLEGASLIKEQFLRDAISVSSDDIPYFQGSSEIDNIMPADYVPWWDVELKKQLNPNSTPVLEGIDGLLLRAIAHSSQIKVFSDLPLIRQTAELEARGNFDPHAYFDYKWTDLDEPVGSTLKTGGPDRFLEDEWLFRAGLKKKFVTGTELDFSQRWGVLDNNSEFLDPKDQANTRMSITITQPLLNGIGVEYNRSLIDVARIDGSVAMDEFRRQVESHLLEVIRGYWGIYLERANLLQKRELLSQTAQLSRRLASRSGFDASEGQVRRVRSELLSRYSETIRASTAIRNAESRVLSLLNDPMLAQTEQFEMIPTHSPTFRAPNLSTEMAMRLAMENRPEIDQVFKQIRAAAIRANMTENELRPVLNLFVQYYEDGIAADADTGEAYDSQSDGDGSWVAGLVFDYPLGNREAKARNIRRQIEVRQLTEQLRTTLDTITLELQLSTREARTAFREMNAKFSAMQSMQAEVNMLTERESIELADGARGVVYLELLFDAQNRLIDAQHDFMLSQVDYNIALANLDRATGMTLQTYNIRPELDEQDDLPLYRLVRDTAAN
ncbi:MAG: hypothetical protein DHS20C01_00830 [marine bacterium B5-7]|nr:MAG: hypothetical protein DHS20C01_00830 [marine bacterium B5-7]